MKQSTNLRILELLLSRKLTVSRLYDLLEEDTKKPTVRSAVSRLKRNDRLAEEDGELIITEEGKKYLENDRTRNTPDFIDSPFSDKNEKNLLIIFDVPETRKLYREWLREQLKVFGYTIIQKSVWIGPSPLPKQFEIYLEELGLKRYIQKFHVASQQK